jgi:pyruvate/2-oxoglutarate/acetoin dehydrogenase E1 component
MEHRYLFKTVDAVNINRPIEHVDQFPVCKIYGSDRPRVVILTYGDGLAEALKALNYIKQTDKFAIVAITKLSGDRALPDQIIELLKSAEDLVIIDTANYQGGLLQATVGQIAERLNRSLRVKVFSPPFTPCPTSPLLTRDYYPNAPAIADHLNSLIGDLSFSDKYWFNEANLPMEFDFSTVRMQVTEGY